MSTIFNDRLRQIILLLVIVLLALLLLQQLYIFLPGFLGAVTLYILLKDLFFNCTVKKRWNKTATALVFIFSSLLLIAVPVYFAFMLITDKVSSILSDPADMMIKAKMISIKIEQVSGMRLLTDEHLASIQNKAGMIVPKIVNSSASILGNFAIMFFLLYFLLKNGREAEKFLQRFIPLKEENVSLLSNETKKMIRANAIGIPILAILQGIIATLGYWIFGVKDFALWGFLTGFCSMIPIVGTTLIWIPLTAYFFATNNSSAGIGLLIYAAVLITNIDYVARLTILKRLMDIHPLITIFGVIVGISLFGFWGVIFGPLLISYFIILVKIYMNEFGNSSS